MTARCKADGVDRHVGRRVRERRVTLGITQQQLAEGIGVTYQQAHKYESGINRISAGRLYQITLALGVDDINWFFEGAESDQRPLLSKLHSPSAVKLMETYAGIANPEARRAARECVDSIAEKYRRPLACVT